MRRCGNRLLLFHSIANFIHSPVAPDSHHRPAFSRYIPTAWHDLMTATGPRLHDSLPLYGQLRTKRSTYQALLFASTKLRRCRLTICKPSPHLTAADTVALFFTPLPVRTSHCTHAYTRTHNARTNKMMSTIHELYKFRETCAATTKPTLRLKTQSSGSRLALKRTSVNAYLI